ISPIEWFRLCGVLVPTQSQQPYSEIEYHLRSAPETDPYCRRNQPRRRFQNGPHMARGGFRGPEPGFQWRVAPKNHPLAKAFFLPDLMNRQQRKKAKQGTNFFTSLCTHSIGDLPLHRHTVS